MGRVSKINSKHRMLCNLYYFRLRLVVFVTPRVALSIPLPPRGETNKININYYNGRVNEIA